jgi:predicted nucleotidyltransferase
MICSNCKTEITTVRVYSQCYQSARVQGEKIVDYGAVEEILETLGIECSICGYDLSGAIKEE